MYSESSQKEGEVRGKGEHKIRVIHVSAFIVHAYDP